MEIRPILSALMRSKVALVLIGVQIALTLAIVCNALFIISQRIDKMGRPSGMDEANTFEVGSLGFGAAFDMRTTVQQDLATLRGLPGVQDVTPINRVPMGEAGWSTGIQLQPAQKTATTSTAIYFVDEHALDAMGVKLAAGRNFRADEIGFEPDFRNNGWPPVVIITKALAERLFPGQDAVGKQFYLGKDQPPQTVIGVVERLQAPWLDWKEVEYSTLIPQIRPYSTDIRYVVRAQPGRRDEVMKLAEAKLGEINRSRLVRNVESMEKVRAEGYRADRAMTIILCIVIVCLLTITALGIVGMASFWVTQRTKQIGTRRALGATQFDILRYFLTENFLITSLGLAAGAVLTYAFNVWLMTHYEAPRLPWYYVPVGFLCLWTLGQIAVLGPATRASRVPPAVATRSV
ncbi:ABC transporter permease [Mizugakiibacter sediminis]|uniref:ABC transporter permease n=1 Tax=Mizugakiibacter sediminis TaxID=1475481 RepID=A0A0K8QJK7_9GAMM|nr:FtsX-like permease family protein [Mizugakiibacter sediminis]GAP65120.1 ABC transporter permease [Mizugakiibacter sediminis]